VLLSVSHDNPLVVTDPKPRVRFRTFGDSSLDFELLCWAHRPHDKGRIIHELNREIYKSFARDGIVIPFPQRDVYVHSFKDG
ncbi:MAG: mechanosensitive ion channel, partial [Deltaproteobacteria bacterium]|nr:mechanosensitive ion channel [Deltaproteobacteria bacterium]